MSDLAAVYQAYAMETVSIISEAHTPWGNVSDRAQIVSITAYIVSVVLLRVSMCVCAFSRTIGSV